MQKFKNLFKDYLLEFDSKKFQILTEDLELYKVITYLLARNGTTLSKDNFLYSVFVVSKEYRNELIESIDDLEINDLSFISMICNYILKDLNKLSYQEKKQKNIIAHNKKIDLVPFNDENNLEIKEDVKTYSEQKVKILDKINIEKSFKYREAMKMYFGLERFKPLTFRIIREIYNIKKSTFYAKISSLKDKLNENC